MFHQHRVEFRRWAVTILSNHKTLFSFLWMIAFASVFLWQKSIFDGILVFKGAALRPIPRLRPVSFNITDFGAVGDGLVDNTAAFEKAVAAVSEVAEKGGGQINVPPGIWLTCPFNLTSHLTLFLAQDAVILGIDRRKMSFGEDEVMK